MPPEVVENLVANHATRIGDCVVEWLALVEKYNGIFYAGCVASYENLHDRGSVASAGTKIQRNA